jgi:ABC-type branched-subunit amino acid transport system substrate-binding protein
MNNGINRRNPYIVGRPIDESDKFFGRESLFQVIEDNLRNKTKLILLYGQRRIGKSSVLKQIPKKVAQEKFVFVNFDIQDKSYFSLYEILHRIAIAIIENLELDGTILPPSSEEIKNNNELFSRIFLQAIYQQLGDKSLVLLLDEFDVLSEKNSALDNRVFFAYIKSLLKQQERLFIIPVVGRHLNELKNLRNFFSQAPYKEIALLDEDSTQRLITKPAEGMLTYESQAIQAIFKKSAGHPFFTQVICFTLFGRARELDKWNVTGTDVEDIVDRVFKEETAQAGLAWFWDGLPISERVVLSAVAEAQKIAIEKEQRVPEEPLTLLSRYGVIVTEALNEAAKQLAENGFLDDTGRRIKIELVRCWLVRSHPLQHEIQELEKVDQEHINPLLEVANSLGEEGRKQNALDIYEQVLVINPNHFSCISQLAKVYLEAENFDRALELYTRTYQFDPVRNTNEFLLCLEIYGHKLITQRAFSQAKEQFNRVLEIYPHRSLAQQKLAEIAAYESGVPIPLNPPSILPPQQRKRKIIRGSIAVAIVAAITVPIGLVVYNFSTPCPAGQQKHLGIFCQPDTNRISRGDRTLLFPNIKNENRDRGIQAFKNGNYLDATQFFKMAVANNRNNPELLIYYNNSLARLHGSPFILAAVVPTENKPNFAQEMLRGVAQAQNQFNDKGGFNGRLLEIVIANDGNEPDKAKLIASELIKDPSILGVIGHNSSDATKTALSEYEKAELAIISPTSSSILVKNPVFFRAVASDEVAGQKLAEYAYNKLKLKKVVIFSNPNSQYSDSLREVFTKHFEKLGGEIVRKPYIDLTSPTLDAEKEVPVSIYRYKAEAAMLFPDTQHTHVALKIITANGERKNRPQNNNRRWLQLLGGHTLYSNETLSADANAVEDLIIEAPWFKEVPEAKDFAQKAEKQWGGGISWRTATSFDATQAFIKAISLSPNPSRSTTLKKLGKVNLLSSDTSGYPLQFTDERERQGEPILVKVKGGKFVKLE